MAALAKARLRSRALDKAARERGKFLSAGSISAPRAFRCAVLGDAEVGKSAFCARARGDDVGEDYAPTMSAAPAESAMTVITADGPVLVTLVDWAWDQVYQVDKIDVLPAMQSAPDGALYVFSYAAPDSFKNLPLRFSEYERAVGGSPCALYVGNKTDAAKLRVKDPDVWDAARKKTRCDFARCSALDDDGVDEALLALARLLLGDEKLDARIERGA